MATLILLAAVYYDSIQKPAEASNEFEPPIEYSLPMPEQEMPLVQPEIQEPTIQEDIAQNIEILDTHDVIPGSKGGQCVAWIQNYFGTYYTNPTFRGHARYIKPNATTPTIGAAVLTHEGEYHTALVIAVDGNEIVLAESNYKGDERITVGRRLNINSPKIRGYFNFSH